MSILKDGGAGVDVFNGDAHTPDNSEPRDGPRDPNLRSLLERVDALESDEDLDALFQALRDRRRDLRERAVRQLRRELAPGDTVRFVNISPKYLTGLTATVVYIPGGRKAVADVQIPKGDPRYGKYARGTGRLTAYLSTLERVDTLDEAADADDGETPFERG